MEANPEDLRDIAGPIEVMAPTPWWVWPLGIAGVILLGLLIAWCWKTWRKTASPPPKTPREKIEIALAAAEQAIGQQTPHDFSIRLSDALRVYITDQHQLRATHQTSQEFLASLNEAQLPKESEQALQQFLERCDNLKYARDGGDDDDCRALLEAARRFCEADRQPTTEPANAVADPDTRKPPPLPSGGAQ